MIAALIILAFFLSGSIGYWFGHMRGYDRGNDDAEAAMDVTTEPEAIRGHVTLHDDGPPRNWTWTARSTNGEVISSAWGYDSKAGAKRAAKENMSPGCVLKGDE